MYGIPVSVDIVDSNLWFNFSHVKFLIPPVLMLSSLGVFKVDLRSMIHGLMHFAHAESQMLGKSSQKILVSADSDYNFMNIRLQMLNK